MYVFATVINERLKEKITVNNLSGTLVFGDYFRRAEIQLLLLPLIVRHRFGTL